jgi:hypothetical protein
MSAFGIRGKDQVLYVTHPCTQKRKYDLPPRLLIKDYLPTFEKMYFNFLWNPLTGL